MSEYHDESGSSLAWFLAGGILGAVGALLLAPQSGQETREVIRRRTEESRQRAYEAGRQAAERGRVAYAKSRDVAENAVGRGKEVVEKGKSLYEKGRQMADDAASRLRKEGGEIADSISETSEA
jgi:gas vesicle protein